MSNLINNYLVITTLGINSINLIDQFIKTISNTGSNILNTKITSMGTEFTCSLFISGDWGAIAKIEIALSSLEKEFDIKTIVQRTSPKINENKSIPYIVNLMTIDKIGILQKIINFFTKKKINIEDISTHTYYAPNNTKMANITININLNESIHIATLREKFITYCDELT